jgi:pilus assembly protein Flp/PilA
LAAFYFSLQPSFRVEKVTLGLDRDPTQHQRSTLGAHFQTKEENMSKFMAFMRDESGAAAAEYALILAVVGSGVYLAAQTLGGAISGVINAAAGVISGITFS